MTELTLKQRSLCCSLLSSISIAKLNSMDTTFNFGIQQQITGKTKEVNTLKTLMVQWICGSLRPVSIITDKGFTNSLQAAVSLGKDCFAKTMYVL